MQVKLWLHGIALLSLAAFGLTGCGLISQSTPQALPTVSLDSGAAPTSTTAVQAPAAETAAAAPAASGGVSASGKVVPFQVAQLGFSTGGNINLLDVKEGDQVSSGQMLVSLAGSEQLTAAVKAANLELLTAQQALADLQNNASQDLAAAQLRVAKAADALDTAQKHRSWKLYRVGSDNQIAVARADLIVAEDTVKKAEESYGGWADNPEDNLNKAAALSALSGARTRRDKALANLNYLLSLPNPIEVAKADADLAVAKAESEAAQKQYNDLINGPDPAKLVLAQARIDNAKAQLEASQAALANLELKAPFTGTVNQVNYHSGEWVLPGQAILVLVDVSKLHIETTDLSERDVPRIKVGQPVTARIKALGLEVNGHVTAISLLADTLGGDVIYKTTIELDSIPADLRAGMSVDLQFASE